MRWFGSSVEQICDISEASDEVSSLSERCYIMGEFANIP